MPTKQSECISRPHGDKKQTTLVWEPNVRLAELVYIDGNLQFAVKEPGKEIQIAETVENWSLVGWLLNIARRGALRLPSGPTPYGSLHTLAASMGMFVEKYFDCEDDFRSVMVLYALMTWIYERFHAVPYLRLLGSPASGKSRASDVMASICNRGLLLSGGTSVAGIFRHIEVIGGTLVLDEADYDRSQIGSDIAKILNCGYQKGISVVRNATDENGNWFPKHYDVFGPKVLNGRRPFIDEATESRCLTYTPRPTLRRDIPRQLPPEYENEALDIRNMALQWRFETLDTFVPSAVELPGLRARAEQILTPLLNIVDMIGAESERYRQGLTRFAQAMEKQAKEDSRSSVEFILLQEYINWSNGLPTCNELFKKVHQQYGNDDLGWSPGLRQTVKTLLTVR